MSDNEENKHAPFGPSYFSYEKKGHRPFIFLAKIFQRSNLGA